MAKIDKSKKYPREGKEYNLKSSAQRAAKEDGLIQGQFEVVPGKKGSFKYVLSESFRAVLDQMEPGAQPAKDNVKQALEELGDDGHEPLEDQKPEPKIVDRSDLYEHGPDRGIGSAPEPQTSAAPEVPPKEEIVYRAPPTPEEQERKERFASIFVDEVENPPVKQPEQVPVAPGLPPIVAPGTVPSKTSGQPARVVTQAAPRGAPVTKLPKWAEGKTKSQIESPTKTVWHIADELTAANPSITRKSIIEECVKRGIAYYTARTQVQLWRAANLEDKKNAAKNGNGKK